jgi:hypothetical protein
MDKSIENIWKSGYVNKEFILPKIEKMYNQKSISYVEKMITGFKWEVYILIPATALIFLFNIWLENDNAIFWGIISSIPCVFWFFLGKEQLKSLKKHDYLLSSYDYLVSIRAKLISIRKYNRNLAIFSIPIFLFPMLLYTYYNQAGKTIGEIFGVNGFNYSTIYLFLLLPIFTLLIVIIANINYKIVVTKTTTGIDALISEIEELKE